MRGKRGSKGSFRKRERGSDRHFRKRLAVHAREILLKRNGYRARSNGKRALVESYLVIRVIPRAGYGIPAVDNVLAVARKRKRYVKHCFIFVIRHDGARGERPVVRTEYGICFAVDLGYVLNIDRHGFRDYLERHRIVERYVVVRLQCIFAVSRVDSVYRIGTDVFDSAVRKLRRYRYAFSRDYRVIAFSAHYGNAQIRGRAELAVFERVAVGCVAVHILYG